jgi:hypothetical protein
MKLLQIDFSVVADNPESRKLTPQIVAVQRWTGKSSASYCANMRVVKQISDKPIGISECY